MITITNYDFLIEEAVGAGPVSYSLPGEILSIIRGGENRVIHLHGVYDKLHGLDDIILEKDCNVLTEFFDDRSGKAGAQNLFADLFVSMDELVEDDGEEYYRQRI